MLVLRVKTQRIVAFKRKTVIEMIIKCNSHYFSKPIWQQRQHKHATHSSTRSSRRVCANSTPNSSHTRRHCATTTTSSNTAISSLLSRDHCKRPASKSRYTCVQVTTHTSPRSPSRLHLAWMRLEVFSTNSSFKWPRNTIPKALNHVLA